MHVSRTIVSGADLTSTLRSLGNLTYHICGRGVGSRRIARKMDEDPGGLLPVYFERITFLGTDHGQTRESRQEQVQTKPQTIRRSSVRHPVRRLCSRSCHRSAEDGRRGNEILVQDCGSPRNRNTFRRVTIAPRPFPSRTLPSTSGWINQRASTCDVPL
jgi:hypothetical protein